MIDHNKVDIEIITTTVIEDKAATKDVTTKAVDTTEITVAVDITDVLTEIVIIVVAVSETIMQAAEEIMVVSKIDALATI
jgi:hypothetical protein